MTGRSACRAPGLVQSDYSEKWPVTYLAARSLLHRKEGSR